MTLEKGSLILLDYTAKIKDTNEIFETTRENDVKSSENFDPSRKYEPRLLGVGEGWVLKGLDDALLNANMDEPLNIEIPPDKLERQYWPIGDLTMRPKANNNKSATNLEFKPS